MKLHLNIDILVPFRMFMEQKIPMTRYEALGRIRDYAHNYRITKGRPGHSAEEYMDDIVEVLMAWGLLHDDE